MTKKCRLLKMIRYKQAQTLIIRMLLFLFFEKINHYKCIKVFYYSYGVFICLNSKYQNLSVLAAIYTIHIRYVYSRF